MSVNKIHSAIVQQPPVYMNLEASIDKAVTLIRKAAQDGADLVIFPETWLPGYPVWLDHAPDAGLWDHPPAKKLYKILTENSVNPEKESFKQLQHVIEDTQIYVVIGGHEKVGRTLYNTMFFFNRDGTHIPHRKLMPTYTERLIWGMGDGSTLNSMDTEYGTIGGLICWEHWMPLARAAMHSSGEALHIAQWPLVKDLHQLCSRHYAFEGQCFVAASGCTMSKGDMLEGLESLNLDEDMKPAMELIRSIPAGDEELLLKGGSSIIAPDTHFVSEPVYGSPETVFAEIDLSSLPEGNLVLDTDGHYSRPDVFNLEVDTTPKKQVKFNE